MFARTRWTVGDETFRDGGLLCLSTFFRMPPKARLLGAELKHFVQVGAYRLAQGACRAPIRLLQRAPFARPHAAEGGGVRRERESDRLE